MAVLQGDTLGKLEVFSSRSVVSVQLSGTAVTNALAVVCRSSLQTLMHFRSANVMFFALFQTKYPNKIALIYEYGL